MALPLYFALHGLDVKVLAASSTLAATGDFLGLILVPFFMSRFSSRSIALATDLSAFLIMFGYFVALHKETLSISSLVASSFVVALLFGVWFASSEVTLAGQIGRVESEGFQRLIVFSGNLGPVVGPAIGGLLFPLIGLSGIAATNALSFLIQFFGLAHLTQNFPQHLKQSRQGFIESISVGLKSINSSPVIGRIIVTSIILKLFLLVIPFIAFRLKELGIEAPKIGLTISMLGTGLLFSTLTYQAVGKDQLGSAYKISSTLMIASALATTMIGISTPSIPLIGSSLFIWGYFIGRYQIQFRALRQITEDPTSLPAQIMAAGIFARSGTLLSGVLFGALFHPSFPPAAFFVAAAALTFALYRVNAGLEKNYRDFLSRNLAA